MKRAMGAFVRGRFGGIGCWWLLAALCCSAPLAGVGQTAGFAQTAGFTQTAGFAQAPFQYRGTASMGLAQGQAGGDFRIETVNGIAKGPWFLGAGAALDYYRFRTAPLYIAASRDLRLGSNEALVLFLNGGTNLPVGLDGSSPNYGDKTSFSGGAYWSGGLSLFLKQRGHPRNGILLTAGYEVKKVRETLSPAITPTCPNPNDCSFSTEYFQYLNRAVLVMVGYRF